MNNKYLLLFLSFFLILSCKKEDYTNHSKLSFTNPSITVTGIPDAVFTIENDTTYEFKVVLDKPTIVDLHLTVSLIETSATNDEDFEFGTTDIFIPAHSSTASFTLNILTDDIVEGDETFSVVIGSDEDINFNNPKTIQFTISDYISDEFSIDFIWNKIVFVPGFGNTATCPNYDLDFYLYDQDWNDTENYGAATGNCPESLTFNRLTDTGTFYITQALWQNEYGGLGLTDAVPVSCGFYREGSYAYNVGYVQPNADAFTVSTLDYAYDGEWSEQELIKLVVSNTGFTVYNLDDVAVASARKAPRNFLPKDLMKPLSTSKRF